MRNLLLVSVLSLAVTGCSKAKSDRADQATGDPHAMVEAKLPTLSIDELDAQLAAGACTPVDANGDRTREKLGVIPGAVLLTDSETFLVGELPADKARALVFYCANTHCSASHEAASKAITAGYTNVKVLPDGIAGWVKAGKQIQTI